MQRDPFEVRHRRYHWKKKGNGTFVSSKFNFNDPTDRSIYLPQIKMRVGQACSALIRSWASLRLSNKDNDPTGDIKHKILTLQGALGIEKDQSIIEDLLPYGYSEEELNYLGEQEEDIWGLDTEEEEESSLEPEEIDPELGAAEQIQLRREEVEVESEVDGW